MNKYSVLHYILYHSYSIIYQVLLIYRNSIIINRTYNMCNITIDMNRYNGLIRLYDE